jgi:glycosyltransferase involved in cell wall biosynthesis
MPSPIKLLLAIVEIHGGTGAFAQNLADGLRKYFPNEFQIDLLTMRSAPMSEADQHRFDHIHTAKMTVSENWRRFPESIPNFLKLRRTLKHIDSDIILALHNFPSLMIPLVAPRRTTIKSVHTHLSTLLKKNITRPVLKAIIKNRYQKDLVIVPTQGVADDLAQNFNVTSAKIIPHGIDLDRVQTLAAETVPDLPPQPYIVSLGRLTQAKDYPTTLRAFAEAKSKGLPHNLVILGAGELDRDLRNLAHSLNIAPHTHFLGHRDNPYPYLKHADFFVLSSTTESFGLALLEAMALALPTIATQTAGALELLRYDEFGILAPIQNPSALANEILDLANSPARRSHYSEQSRRRAANYTLEKMTRHYRDLFLQILNH